MGYTSRVFWGGWSLESPRRCPLSNLVERGPRHQADEDDIFDLLGPPSIPECKGRL